MWISYKLFLCITRTCIAALFLTVIGSQGVWAEAGLQANGDYDDGTLLWSEIHPTRLSHSKAVELCQSKTSNDKTGRLWSLPTEEQLKQFYETEKSKLPDSNLGLTWSSTQLAGKHRQVNLATGKITTAWYQTGANEILDVTCVTSSSDNYLFDGKLTWSKIAENDSFKTWNQASEYCANKDQLKNQKNKWRIPTVEEVQKFAADVVPPRTNSMRRNGWALDHAWAEGHVYDGRHAHVSLIPQHVNLKGPLYGNPNPELDKDRVTCVY